MTRRFDALEHALNQAVGSDDERRTIDAHILAAHKLLFLPNPVSFSDLMLNVGEKRVR